MEKPSYHTIFLCIMTMIVFDDNDAGMLSDDKLLSEHDLFWLGRSPFPVKALFFAGTTPLPNRLNGASLILRGDLGDRDCGLLPFTLN